MTRVIDLNADLGEGYGAWSMGDDDALLAVVTSANVACGGHAGDGVTMRRTVAAAVARGVSIGAHPGHADREGFGRRAIAITPDEAYALVLAQVGALSGFTRAAQVPLAHVKPHGALYSQAATEPGLAAAIAAAVRDFDATLALVGPPGSAIESAGLAAGLRVWREGFVDRTYQADGTLTPRSRPEALHHDPAAAVRQAVMLATEGVVIATDGAPVAHAVDTLCVHGDAPGAVALARAVRGALGAAGVVVAAPGRTGR